MFCRDVTCFVETLHVTSLQAAKFISRLYFKALVPTPNITHYPLPITHYPLPNSIYHRSPNIRDSRKFYRREYQKKPQFYFYKVLPAFFPHPETRKQP